MKRLAFWSRRKRLSVVELRRSNPVRFGAIALVLIAIGVYFAFTKHVPFTHGYRFKAVFASAQNIAPKSPVRIAGVEAGRVTAVKREGNAGVVTMELSESALPIHRDATVKILPRLFLEGNWFVELRPGRPSSPTLPAGGTLPITQTADPVQIDQVLDALNTDTRANLQHFLAGYGEALMHKPTSAEDRTQTPEVKGLSGAEALKDAALQSPGALRGSAIVEQSLGGVETHDISKLIKSIARVTAALSYHEQTLGEWVDHFDKFFEAFALQAESLKATIGQLPSALHSAKAAFAALRRAAPSIESFSTAIVPGVKQTRSTIAASLPWIEAVEGLLAPDKLGGVATSLSEASPSLASLIGGQQAFFKQTDEFSKCLTKTFYPAGEEKINDGKASSGEQVYKEFWYTMVGLAGIGQSFDGNGAASRFLAGGGGHTLISRPTSLVGVKGAGNQVIGHATLLPEGTSPKFPASEPPYKPLVPCYTQKPPNVNGPLSHGPADGAGK